VEKITSDAVYSLELPFPLGIVEGDRVYLSGRTARDPETGDPISGVIAQTERILTDIELMLTEVGLTADDLVTVTIYLKDMSDIGDVNSVYEEYLTEPYPARSAVEVSDLAADFDIEIEAVAAR
jgi:2-iminobutanoate/2-iminopropanoate deaminase